MAKKENREVKETIRGLVDKIGTAGDGFSIFFGAGASKVIGLPTMKELADSVEKTLSSNPDKELSRFLSEIISILKSERPEGITIEQILEMLYHIHFLVENREKKVSLALGQIKTINTAQLLSSINFIKEIIWNKCHSIDADKLTTHIDFLRCLMSRAGSLRELDIFTTNWDFSVEITCDELKYKCIDGFIGMFNGFERFREFNEDRGKQAQNQLRIVYLHKLHGSLNWIFEEEAGEIRKRINWKDIEPDNPKRFMIFPIPSKSKEILGYPYGDLIGGFSDALLKKANPLLLIIGYNFTDTHITNKISTMLQNNEHSNLFIVDPNLKMESISNKLGIDAKTDARVTLLQLDFVKFIEILKELIPYE